MYVSLDSNGAWDRYFDVRDVRDQPNTRWMMARLGTDFAVARRDMVSDEQWYNSDFYHRVCEPGGWDDMCASHVGVASMETIHGITFARPKGERITNFEVELVRTLHAELAFLWRKPEAIEIDSLPGRLLEALAGMRRGLSRKEIAEEMNVSPHTVHSYEKQLSGRFEVSGRGALLAKVARVIQPSLPK